MKLVSFKKNDQIRIGAQLNSYVLDFCLAAKEFHLVSIPSTMEEFLGEGSVALKSADQMIKSAQKRIQEGKKCKSFFPLKSVKLTAPVTRPEKIICVGQNYIDHCKEQNIKPPDNPIIFTKFNTALTGPFDKVILPKISNQVDFETELAFVIGKKGMHISKEKSMGFVAGYMILNDISARDIQFSDGQWVRGKSLDSFAPCGPALITKDEIKNPHNLKISLKLNGQIMQNSNTKNLIFDIPYLIWFISQNITLKPGDIISTGTPPGVGVFRNPPIFLKHGDILETTVESIGTLINNVQNEYH